jgi:hypothetical protein
MALLVLMLACLLLQSTAVQAHVHLAHLPTSLAAAADGPAQIKATGDEEAAAPCALCLAAASAGHYVLASGNALPPPPARVLGTDPRSLPEFRLLSPAHGWLSRAPPQ